MLIENQETLERKSREWFPDPSWDTYGIELSKKIRNELKVTRIKWWKR